MTDLHPFVRTLVSLRTENCFNPYVDRCLVHDLPDAPKRRADALSAMIKSATTTSLDSMWLGRDLGYRGGRRTGLALTDDIHIHHHAKRWNLVARRATIGPPMSERTASIVWGVLDRIDTNIFLWNVFPLHPHKPNEPFTNRPHSSTERRAGEELLRDLVKLLRPARLVAVGADAAVTAVRVADAIPVVPVRHPSYGGQSLFLRQVVDLYGVPARQGHLL